MPRVVDASIFFNENQLFQLRYMELRSCVDTFIVVEATRTHSGARKGVFFDRRPYDGDGQKNNVVHFIVDDLPIVEQDNLANRWLPEQFQRNSIIRPLMLLELSDDDVVLISDVDEIPSAASVAECVEVLQNRQVVVFTQHMKKFFLNNDSSIHWNNSAWLGTVACKFGAMKQILPQGLRLGDPFSPRASCVLAGYGRELYPYEARLPNAGWHLSSMGGLEAYMQKLHSFAGGSEFGHRDPILKAPATLHNNRRFREDKRSMIDNFIAENCPVLLPIDLHNTDQIAALEIPSAIKADPLTFQSLFFLENSLC